MFFSFETRATPLTTIRRERVLPVPGEVIVDVGDRVEPAQVVARADLPGDFRILPVALLLGVRSSKASHCLRVKAGDEVQAGQVVASRRGLSGRSVKSPIDGVMTASGAGRVLIEAHPTQFGLAAYLHGTVASVVERYGAVVETTGALIEGAWGSGDESFGVLKCIVDNPDEPVHSKSIDPSCHGTILVGGAQMDDEALESAQQFQVRGIVTGGLAPGVLSQAEKMPFPIVVTEGIGTVPMSAPIFRLLTTYDGREASISGKTQPRWGIVRPEIVIPLPAEELPAAPAKSGAPIAVGIRVRVVRAPYAGATGTIVALPAHTRPVETGARVRGAEVDIGEERPVFVPLVNLEALR